MVNTSSLHSSTKPFDLIYAEVHCNHCFYNKTKRNGAVPNRIYYVCGGNLDSCMCCDTGGDNTESFHECKKLSVVMLMEHEGESWKCRIAMPPWRGYIVHLTEIHWEDGWVRNPTSNLWINSEHMEAFWLLGRWRGKWAVQEPDCMQVVIQS